MRKLSILFFFFCLGCEKIDIENIHNLNNGRVEIIGHAGEGFYSHVNHYPFNSRGSISRALKFHKVDGIEVDFQMTRDFKGILYHDDYLDTQTDCGGSVFNFNLTDLLKCRYSQNIYPKLFQNEYLISLNDAFKIALESPDPKPTIFIDIKINPTNLPVDIVAFKDSMANYLSNEILNYLPGRVHFISEDELLLEKIKNKAPLSHYHLAGGDAYKIIAKAVEKGFSGIITTEEALEVEESAEAHRNNLTVTLFGVRSIDDIEDALELNPDYVQTDNIPLLQNVLNSK